MVSSLSFGAGSSGPRRFAMRLLPVDPSQSWTPYAWLIYLVVLFVPPFLGPFSRLAWAATIGSLLIFLPLYFWAYWLSGRALLWIGLVSFTLGVALAPLNPFSYTFVIYTGGFIGRMGSNRWVIASLTIRHMADEQWLTT